MVLLLGLAGCTRAQVDPRIAENATPRMVARVIDRAGEKPECDQDELVEWLRCRLTPAPRVGCVYVELGDAIDAPLTRPRRAADDCSTVPVTSRVRVANQPLRQATFFTDAQGERVVLKTGEEAHVFLFRNGALFDWRALPTVALSVFRADGTLDWARVPSLLDVLPAHLGELTDAELDALVRATPEGTNRLEDAIVAAVTRRDVTPDDDAWPRLWARLSDARRPELFDELLDAVESGDGDAARWAEKLPVPRERLVEALVTSLAATEEDGDDVPEAFDVLGRLAPQRLAPMACHRLETAWFTSAEDDGSLELVAVALAVIARERLSCPWVTPWLLRAPCAWQLREEGADGPTPTAPLASDETQRQVIARTLSPATLGDEPERDLSEPWGALLLAAAHAQGPLPREFELHDARRFYRRVYTRPDDACRDAGDEVAEWACQLPVTLSALRRDGCTVTLDDPQRVMTLRSEDR